MTNRSLDTNWTIGNYKNNRYREVDDYIEVEIYGGGEYHIGQIDKDFLDRFTERTWTAAKQEKQFYMRSYKTKKFASIGAAISNTEFDYDSVKQIAKENEQKGYEKFIKDKNT